MPLLVRLIRALAAPGFARNPPLRTRLAPEVVGGLLGVVALVAAVGNAGALAAVLANLTRPGSLGGWLPALGTLLGSGLGVAADILVGLGAFALARDPRRGAERVVAGLLAALAATLVLGAATGALPVTIGYIVVLLAVYALVTVTAAGAGRGIRLADGGSPTGPHEPDRAPVPWILPPPPRGPKAWRRPDPAVPPAVPPAAIAEPGPDVAAPVPGERP